MVSTSARKAGDPWFDFWSGHDRFCASVSICLYIVGYGSGPLDYNYSLKLKSP